MKDGDTITRKEAFKTELDLISSPQVKSVAEGLIQRLPEYFFKISASSTGKYHPKYATGEGGLVRHTKAAVKIANSLLGLEQNAALNESRDIIILALIIHDGLKHGENGGTFSVFDHALICAEWIKKQSDLMSQLTQEQQEMLYKAVASHMGQWTTDKNGKEILPKPASDIDKFVHICDYLASRKWLDVDFEGDYYDGKLEKDADLSEIISKIVSICKQKISSGVDRELIYQIIRNASGVANPLKITDVKTAQKVLLVLSEED